MKTIPTFKLRMLQAIIAGCLVWVLCMGVAIHAALAAPGPHLNAQPAAGLPIQSVPPEDCAECHPDVQAAWIDSPHAHAFDDPVFTERWMSLGEPGECLVCHTTGYAATTAEYSAEGVTCEACHGPAVEGHPPGVVPVRGDTEYCGTCHTTTLGEWRLTGHASAGVGCTDCHNPHSQAALFENPDEMCVNCHKDDLGEHQNDIHITKGISCVECHALVIPEETPPPDGLVPTGHTFMITPITCVSCHTDTLHIGEPLPGYETGAKSVAASLPVTSTIATLVSEYTGAAPGDGSRPDEQTIQALETALASTRLSTLFQGGIIGLVLGGSTAYFIARNRPSIPNGDEDEEGEESPEAISGVEDGS